MKRLIFVYNANSSIFSVVTDYVHKIVSPKTYNCNLCMLTYDNLGMKKEWRDFIVSIGIPLSFLHKDELAELYPEVVHVPLPAIFSEYEKRLALLVSSEEINDQKNIQSLIRLVENKIKSSKHK